MIEGLLEYLALAVAYAVLAAATVELLLVVWRVQDPVLDIALRLQVLLIPPLAPALFLVLNPSFGRQAVALLDTRNWLGPQPALTHPLWILLVVVMAATAGLEAIAFFRWITWGRSGRSRSLSEPVERLIETTRRLASKGVALPPVRVAAHIGPVAYTVGLLRPSILISSSLVQLLDDEELEVVLAHEQAHVGRQDNWFGWLTFALRVLSFYNPVVQFTYHRMGHDVERVCDAEAGRATGKPLALASALIKVYMATRAVPVGRHGLLSALSTQATSLENRARRALVEDRVERLVHPNATSPTSYPQLRFALAMVALVGLEYLVV